MHGQTRFKLFQYLRSAPTTSPLVKRAGNPLSKRMNKHRSQPRRFENEIYITWNYREWWVDKDTKTRVQAGHSRAAVKETWKPQSSHPAKIWTQYHRNTSEQRHWQNSIVNSIFLCLQLYCQMASTFMKQTKKQPQTSLPTCGPWTFSLKLCNIGS